MALHSKLDSHFKSILTKICIFILLTFLALGFLFPSFETWVNEWTIVGKILILSVVILTITELLRLFKNRILIKHLPFYVLLFYALLTLISLYFFALHSYRYVDAYMDHTALFPPQTVQDSESFSQFKIVITDKVNPELQDSIDRYYFGNPLLFLEAIGGLVGKNRSIVYDEKELEVNDKTIVQEFFRALLFALLLLSAVIELVSWVRQLPKAKEEKSEEIPEKKTEETIEEKSGKRPQHRPEKTLKKNRLARDLVADSRTEEALEVLSEICPQIPHFLDQLTLLKSQLSQYRQKERTENPSIVDEFGKELNKINKRILEFINDLEKEFTRLDEDNS